MMNGFSNSIVLLGCKQCGKSTHGHLLAKQENLPFYETEQVIEQLTSTSFKKLYKNTGFPGLMEYEALACKKISDRVEACAGTDKPDRAVIATTSQICDNPLALQELRRIGVFITLQIDIDFIIDKIQSRIQKREDGKFINLPDYVAIQRPKKIDTIHEIILDHYQQIYKQFATISDKVVEIKNAPIESNFQLLLKAI